MTLKRSSDALFDQTGDALENEALFMQPRDLPGDLEPLFDRDWHVVSDLRAWSADRQGAGARRRVQGLGDALREEVLGAGVADASEVIAAGAPAVVDILSRHPVLVSPTGR